MIKRKKKIIKSIMLMVICTLFTSTGQYFWKVSSANINDFYSFITNMNVLLGFLFYGVGSIFLLLSLRDVPLSIAYPVLSTGYIWVLFMGYFLLNESIHLEKGLGIGAIIVGVMLLGKGGE